MTRAIETACLLLLLVVIGLRPLISETYSSARSPLTASLGEVTDPLPAVTLAIDALILLAVAGWLLARNLGSARPYRRCGLEWGLVLVAAAGGISCLAAANKRLAINATVDWLMLPLVTIVLVQLLRYRWQIRMTLCVILATAAVQAYECYNQVCYSFPETEQFYEENKERIWAARGIELDSPTVALYERRMLGREATGFMAHGNVTGGYLVMAGLAAMACAAARWRSTRLPFRRGLAGVVVLAGAGLLGGAALTGSTGALVGGLAGVAAWILRLTASQWIERNRARALLLAWGLVAGGVLATIGHGLYHNSLPGASLNFRWQYWTASSTMIRDHIFTGVGRENFGSHYLQYKTIESSEEVSNPHNFLVAAGADWGIVGLAGILAMLVGGSIAATRRPQQGLMNEETDPPDDPPAGVPLRWGLAVGAGIFLARLLLLGSSDPDYLLVATAVPVIVWAAVFAATSLESNRLGRFYNDALPGLAIGINCALLAFLVQDTINFGLLVPGAATTFFALLAIPIALNAPEPRGVPEGHHLARGGWPRWAPLACAGAVLILLVGWILIPVARAGAALTQARNALERPTPAPHDMQPAAMAYAEAGRLDRLDPTPPYESAAWLARYAEIGSDPAAALSTALELTDAAIARDRLSTKLQRQKTRLCRQAYDLTLNEEFLVAAIEPARRVTELYPQSPEAHAELGACLLDAARLSADPGQLTEARKHLTRALDLDTARPSWETMRRLPARRLESIRKQIDESSRLLEYPR